MAGEIADILLMDEHFVPAEPSQAREETYVALIQRTKAGDTAAFEQLMIATQHRVASVAWRMLENREDARDAVQEVFLRVYRNLKRFKEGQSFHPWLYRISVNVCRDMARRQRRRNYQTASLDAESSSVLIEQIADPTDVEESALLKQQRRLIQKAIASLPYKEKAAFLLRDLEGLSTEEVARVLGSRPATVRVQISSARARIKRYCQRLIRQTKRD